MKNQVIPYFDLTPEEQAESKKQLIEAIREHLAKLTPEERERNSKIAKELQARFKEEDRIAQEKKDKDGDVAQLD